MAPRPTTIEIQGALAHELRMSTKIAAPKPRNWSMIPIYMHLVLTVQGTTVNPVIMYTDNSADKAWNIA
ncbi:hypothetical protein BM1_05888 [Bipolaris maydis]|nr:hypothetical protein BM1_05888 [Bipolaris maydis]